jgi:hypothetical protein
MRSRMHALAAFMLLSGPASMVLAQGSDAGKICTDSLNVDKEKLAAYLLNIYPVSTAYLSIGKEQTPLSSYRALVAWLLNKRAAEKAAGVACKGDSCNVDQLGADLQYLLDGKDSQFMATGSASVGNFFEATNQTGLACRQAGARPAWPHTTAARDATAASMTAAAIVASAPATASGPAAPVAQPVWLDPLRVRGNPDQLSVDRSNQAGYASLDRAHVTLANDDVAQSRTNDIVVYSGYALTQRSIGNQGSTYEAVPYVGFKQNRVTTYNGGTAAVTTTRTSQIGMLSAFHFIHPQAAATDDLTVRPDYLINHTDGSRLLTVNFTYTPVRPGWLNDFIRCNNGLAFKPILTGQSRNGIYVARGDATVYDLHQDFLRLGVQSGFTLASTNPRLPFDFTTTFTGLKALEGAQSIHYWKATLTYNLNQNIGLSLDYSNGLLPDTADPERKWALGLSTKF